MVDSKTFRRYEEYGINAILPRTEDIGFRMSTCTMNWCAFSLDEFKEIFIEKEMTGEVFFVLIDIAIGNLHELYEVSRMAKEKYGDRLKLMVGNIANPETYRLFAEIGVDYVRCSVGSGSGCCTATFCGILYPLASLIDECYKIKMANGFQTKIIADGGLSSYRRMIKALALGADYIMLGSALNKLEDSAGKIVNKQDVNGCGTYIKKCKEYYGMASEKGMAMLGKTGTPEGKVIYNECNGTIESFTKEFIGYLRSTMSYCDIMDITDFIGGPVLNVLSENASNQFNQS